MTVIIFIQRFYTNNATDFFIFNNSEVDKETLIVNVDFTR